MRRVWPFAAAVVALALRGDGAPPSEPTTAPVPIAWVTEHDQQGGARHDQAKVQVEGVATIASDAFYSAQSKFFIQDPTGAVAIFSRTSGALNCMRAASS